MSTGVSDLRDFARRYTASWCSQIASAVADCYSAAGSLTINNGVPATGRKAITKVAQEFMSAFPDMRVLMDDLVVKADGVYYHWTLIGTNTGPGGTVESSSDQRLRNLADRTGWTHYRVAWTLRQRRISTAVGEWLRNVKAISEAKPRHTARRRQG